MATEQAVRILEVVEPLARRQVARIRDEAVRRKQTRGADELVRVPPERRARRRAARAQDAFVQSVELFPVFGRLQTLLFRRRRIVDQIRLDRVVLLEERSGE